MTIGFIGAGNMGGAIAIAAAKAVGGEHLLIADLNTEKAAALAADIGATVTDNEGVVANSDYIFLGVKPQMMEAALTALRPALTARETKPVLISMAAGLTVDCIADWSGSLPVIRIMPNTPVAVGEGMTLYTPADTVTDGQIADFEFFMAASGKLCRLPESLIDAGCGVSGCGPAFAYMFTEALAAGGVDKGLDPALALELAAQTVLGAAKMIQQTGRDPMDLRDAVCSPGGATIQGVYALENGGLRDLTVCAVDAAYKRTLEMKQ